MLDYFPDNYTFRYYLRYLFFRYLPNSIYPYILKFKYKKCYNEEIDFTAPQTLSEKVQWIKLYGITDKKKELSDKIFVKDYVLSLIPKIKCAKIYQIVSSIDELDFSKLPEKFVLKTNHAWKTNIVIKNKFSLTSTDFRVLKNFYNKVININYAYWSYYELQYKDIFPKIFAEEFLSDDCDVVDYEIWCFNGKAKFISYRYSKYIDGHRVYEQCFFDTKWKQLNFYIDYQNGIDEFLCKDKDLIINYAQILAKDIDFVRVDFMEINNNIYFCEMTFTPCSGFFKIIPEGYDFILGQQLKLNFFK